MRDLIGRTLGHYRIAEKIGEGGMGEVYRAHDEPLDRDVAIKVLPEAVAEDPQRLARFEREARAVAKLAHPNILEIWDFGSEDGVAYAVMELLEGESLRELISKGGITTGKAVEYARSIADGLAAAHDKDIIHRDLKPENVFLTTDGRIKILDFGLAKLKLPEADLTTETPTATLDTAPGGLIGTVPYMAPEQVQGQPADHRSDIFALGVVLYEMLTGHRPFGGSTTVETAAAILKEDPEPISVAAPAVSPALGNVVSRCLEKRPEDRFDSARDLSATLGALGTPGPGKGAIIDPSPPPRWQQILFIAAAVILFLVFSLKGHFGRLVEQAFDVDPPRIVVLPFENLGLPDDEYFADGMTEEIISRLSAVSGLLVISRTSAMQYKSTDKAIRQIGEELNVQYVLEGTVRWERTGEGFGRVRITPQLIKVADDTHLWSDRYDRAIESVFEVQADIAQQVVGQLHVNLLKPEGEVLSVVPTENRAAYDAYLRGLYFFNSGSSSAQQLHIAADYFEQAVMEDPMFALAWAQLANTHSRLFSFGHDRSPGRKESAKTAAERALEIDPDLAEGFGALGYFYYGCNRDYGRARIEYDKALEIRPNYGRVRFLRGVLLKRQGRFREALIEYDRSAEISPMEASLELDRSIVHRFLREYAEAEQTARRAISLSPRGFEGLHELRLTKIDQGKVDAARRVLEDAPFEQSALDVEWLEQLIVERRFEEALNKTREMPDSAFRERWGSRGVGQKEYYECRCSYYLGGLVKSNEACAKAVEVFEGRVHEAIDVNRNRLMLGLTYSLIGHGDQAIREIEKSETDRLAVEDIFTGQSTEWAFSIILARTGRFDSALDKIEHLLSTPSGVFVSVPGLRLHPDWDPLRDHPRFQALLEKYDTN